MSGLDGVRARCRRGDLVLVALASAVFLGVGIAVAVFAHPHEDAFILFKYARNVAASEGIVYYPGGPHAEGATDFAWMLLLAAGVRAGAGVAVAAAFVNAAGFFVAGWLVTRAGKQSGPVFLAVLLVGPAATAAYVGFGTMFYGACALALLVAHLDASGPLRASVPILGLVLALVRPDGALLGAAFALLSLRCAWKEGVGARYLGACAGCAAAGAAYFVWRWRYFGLLLPLPLYVKQHFRGVAPGMDDTLDWGWSTLLPLVALALAGCWILGRPANARTFRRTLVSLTPFGLHVASFAANLPSQNVANRFEAPAALALLYAVARLAGMSRGPGSPARAVGYSALVVASQIPLLPILADVARGATRTEYVDELARSLPAITGGRAHIATTEAGRLTYFARDAVLDLDGLNTPETAILPPSQALLDRFDPDLVLIHHAGTLQEPRLGVPDGAQVTRLAGSFADAVTAEYAPLFAEARAGALPDYGALKLPNHVVAPIATMAWLDARPGRYELYAVAFKSSRWLRFHVYALRADSPFRAALRQALIDAHAR